MGDDTLVPGRVISGRFRLQHMLGRGGMGSVWEAYHIALETEIAIKFLDSQLSNRTDIRSRFAQEATAAARIKSPHVVSILDYGFTEDGRGFIAMELLKGEDLAQRIDRLGGLTPAETSEVVVQACRGLAKAHTSGIVHRDLKPENLFVVEDDDGVLVKILDFGIAKAVGLSGSTHKTDTGQILGTPLYMSPEQALGRPIDARSDLYSLSVVAYRALAGRPPFVCDAVGELIVAVSTLVPPPPSAFNPSLPASLDAWFATMLLKDPNARSCQTARDLAESFESACRGLVGSAERATSASARLPASAYTPTVPETPSEGVPAPGSVQRTEAGVTAGVQPAITPGSTVPVPDTLRSERRSRGRLVGTGIALLGAAGAITLTLRSGPGTRALEPATESSRAAAPQAASPPTASPVPDVSLHFRAEPASARLLLDGEALLQNPFAGARPADARQHVLRAEAPGHEPLEQTLTFDRNLDLHLVLKPVPSAASSRPAPPAAAVPVRSRPPTPPVAPAPAAPPGTAAATPPTAPAAPAKTPFEIDRTDPWKR